MKKRSPALVLALFMALSLTACGGGAEDDGAVHLTIWQPTDKEAVENWWVEKLDGWTIVHSALQSSRPPTNRPG